METIDTAQLLVGSLMDWHTWVIIIIVSIFGMLGGLAHKLTSPPEDRTSLEGYLVVGLVASLAVFFVFPLKEEPFKLIALSLVAGYGGKAILDALEARVKTAIAQAETDKVKKDGNKAIETGRSAVEYAQTLLDKATTGLGTNFISRIGQSPGVFSAELKTLSDRLDFLGESFK